MSTTQNLKFIHLASGADAQHSDANVGAIIFEPKSGRIAVDGTSGIEYYGGGRVSNAEFDPVGKVLTISFNDTAETIKLDFSDTASATGVNAIMKAHADRISALEGTVGNASKGLVKDVAANTAAINANKSEIDKINAADTGILATAKGYTDTKLSDLRGTYGGTLQTLRADIDSNDTDIAALQALHAKDGETMKTVKAEIDTKVGAGITGTVEDYVKGEIGKVNTDAGNLKGRVTTLEGKVSGLEETVNNAETGLVKKVDNNAKDITALKGRADALEGVVGDAESGLVKDVATNTANISLNKAAIDTINNVDTGILAQAKSYTNTEIRKVNTAAEALGGRVDTLETTVGSSTSGLVKDVADLKGLHATKNGAMMTVAAEAEAAAAAKVAEVVAGADASYDTLKEIADWILNDTTGAASMANDISALKNTVGDDSKGLVKDVADNKSSIDAHNGRITKLEALHAPGSHDGYSTVAEEVKAGIAGIEEAGVSAGTDVVVTVKTKSGSVSAVEVNADVLAGKVSANTTAIADEAARAKKAEGDLSTTITGIRSDLGQTTDASTVTTTAFGRIKALEEKQSSGSLTWFDWQ